MKNKNKKNSNNYYSPNHIFLDGGEITGLVLGGVGNALQSGIQASQINDMSHIEDQIDQIRNTDFNAGDNTSLMQQWTNAQNLNVDQITFEDVYGSHKDRALQGLAGVASGLSTAITGNWIGGLVNAGANAIGTGIGSLIAKRKAKEKVAELNEANQSAKQQRAQNFDYAVDTLEDQNMFNFLSNYAADGGKIYIKPSKRGTFTAAAKSRGMGVQEFASKVLANKEDYSTAMVKKANFARNAAKWHDEGGPLFTNGGIWSNGLTFINNGDTHEQNPLEGVPMGIAPDGIPNLVEEGEVIYNDYVFSNRLKANKTLLDKYNLPTKYEGKSFAEITKAISKESEERPNDPISKKGLEDSMVKLQIAQEEVREMKQNKKQNIEIPQDTMFDKGGILVRKWADIPEYDITESTDPDAYQGYSGSMSSGSSSSGNNNFLSSLLRYAPVAIQGITALTDALGKTNKPDYSNPDLIAANTQKIAYKPVGNYLTYKPFDINYAANKLANQAAATRRAALDLSGGNRGTAMANLLAADLNAQTALGDAYVESWLANREQEQKVEDFNRSTNMANSQMGLTADQANQRIALSSAVEQAKMREDIDRTVSAAKSQNLSNFLDSLQGIGREATDTQKLNTLIKSNVFGNMTPEQMQGLLGILGGTGLFGANGGKLKRNKRKGLTC